MSELLIPPGAIGRVGMVAALHRVRGEEDGRLVAVRRPIGIVKELLGANTPVFAWQVLVLGTPAKVGEKSCREIIVADKCLRPVSDLPEAEIERLVKMTAQADFDAALADLAEILQAKDITPAEFERFATKALDQVRIERALEVVSIAQVLKEAGFKQVNPPDGEVSRWLGVHEGIQLEISGGPDWFGNWRVAGVMNDRRTAMFDERVILNEWPRGKILQVCADLWKTAFGKAPTPDDFALGNLYAEHMEDIRSLELGLPTVYVVGEIFRATRRWIAQRHLPSGTDMGPSPDLPLKLSIVDGVLHFNIETVTYGCPIVKGWIDGCEISAGEFLSLPVHTLKGSWIKLSVTHKSLLVNNQAIDRTGRN